MIKLAVEALSAGRLLRLAAAQGKEHWLHADLGMDHKSGGAQSEMIQFLQVCEGSRISFDHTSLMNLSPSGTLKPSATHGWRFTCGRCGFHAIRTSTDSWHWIYDIVSGYSLKMPETKWPAVWMSWQIGWSSTLATKKLLMSGQLYYENMMIPIHIHYHPREFRSYQSLASNIPGEASPISYDPHFFSMNSHPKNGLTGLWISSSQCRWPATGGRKWGGFAIGKWTWADFKQNREDSGDLSQHHATSDQKLVEIPEINQS